MKKNYALFALMAFSISVNAYDFTVKNSDGQSIYYNYINGGKEVEITYEGYYKSWNSSKLKYDYWYGGYSSLYGNTLVIPETVTYNERTFPITQIGRDAFHDSGLSYIIIPNSIKDIGNSSFQDSRIVEITIPNSITEIKVSTFSGCTSLKTVSFPDGLKEISTSAFKGCKSLKFPTPKKVQ